MKIWQKIIELVKDIYYLTEKFPKQETYGIISQIRRAAISVASNIAEGSARKSPSEKIQFYSISKGSLSELDAEFEISMELKFIDRNSYEVIQNKIDELSRMLQGLIKNYEEI